MPLVPRGEAIDGCWRDLTKPQVSNAAPPAHHGARRSGGVALCCGYRITGGVRLVGFVAVDPESSVVPLSL
jgi:hypothetical protein